MDTVRRYLCPNCGDRFLSLKLRLRHEQRGCAPKADHPRRG